MEYCNRSHVLCLKYTHIVKTHSCQTQSHFKARKVPLTAALIHARIRFVFNN